MASLGYTYLWVQIGVGRNKRRLENQNSSGVAASIGGVARKRARCNRADKTRAIRARTRAIRTRTRAKKATRAVCHGE